MNHKWYIRLAAAGIFLIASTIQSNISAETLESGLHELSAVKSYEKILDNKIAAETEPLQKSLEQVDVTAKISTLPAKRIYEISNTDFNKYVVVVFPLVPVIPIVFIFLVGSS